MSERGEHSGTGKGAITRRRLLGMTAAGAAGYTLSGAAAAEAQRPRRSVDVAVVGAGLAGLAAARKLVAAGKSVVVLEARDRVGGRTFNRRLTGTKVVEIGGQWVGPTQDRVLGLIDDLGLKTFKTYNQGANVLYQDSQPIQRQTYTGTIPPVDPAGLAEIAVTIERLNMMASEVPTKAPWTAASAVEWDGQTFETWKQDNVQTPSARFLLDLATVAVFAAEPRDISLLHVLFYIHAAGNLNALVDTAGGAQESRIVGGSQLISIRMAQQLGNRVVLGSPVRAIHQPQGNRAEVITDDAVWRALRVIVTVPPALAGQIRYAPRLPALRAQLTQRLPMGTVIKCMAVYDEPFWRADGLTGQVTSDTGPAKVTFDNTPPGGKPGVLLGFIEGSEARTWTTRPFKDRRKAVLGSFVRYFGPQARTGARDYFDKSWAEDPWSRGCYAGNAPPGVMLDYGPYLRRPFRKIHWAGTETATVWNGYMDGAIQSGRRAANEVLKRL